jgi:hypothetical protein
MKTYKEAPAAPLHQHRTVSPARRPVQRSHPHPRTRRDALTATRADARTASAGAAHERGGVEYTEQHGDSATIVQPSLRIGRLVRAQQPQQHQGLANDSQQLLGSAVQT